MDRRRALTAMAIALIFLPACERARQYPRHEKPVAPPPEVKADELEPRWRWMAPEPRRDLPIQFVADTKPEWKHLSGFWSHYPPLPLHLGQMPLEAAVALVVTDQLQAIKIKVPRGLPDPTPNFPPSNPPTYGKWRLGQELFHLEQLKIGDDRFACATCHNPRHGFADGRPIAREGKRNTLSLINVAFNRRQFWEGRVETLEETLVRSLEDERTLDSKQRAAAIEQHVWGGFVRSLVERPDRQLNARFNLVFGLEHPTQDSVAQALATYMRTILSGDSLYDRANGGRADKPLAAEHFRAALTEDDAAKLVVALKEPPTKERLPELLMKGHELFHGKARCGECHKGPLFTDHDFHNVGYPKRPGEDRDEGAPPVGVETGRALFVPIGLKDARLIGAFRTPTLRNLGRTSPYYHHGTLSSLADVIDFYDFGVNDAPMHLAAALKDGALPQSLRLKQDEKDALLVFLRALEGRPVDPLIAGVEK